MNKRNPLKYILFALYCTVLLVLLVGWRYRNMGLPHFELFRSVLNVKPMHTLNRLFAILKMKRPALTRYALTNIIGGILLYLPLGALLPWLFRGMRRIYIALPVCVGVVLTVEIVQLLTAYGYPDVDDALLGAVGSAIGYLIWRIAYTAREKKANGQIASR